MANATTDGEVLYLPETMERATFLEFQAALTVSSSLVLGMVGNWLFYENGIGINILIFTLVILLIGVALHFYLRSKLPGRNLLFVIPALLAAGLLGVRSVWELIFFNGCLLFATAFVVMRFGWHPRLLGGRLGILLQEGLRAIMIGWIVEPLGSLLESYAWFRRLQLTHEQVNQLTAFVRGLLLTLFVMGVFGVLLSSADVVFGNLLADALGYFKPDVSSLMQQFVITSLFAWLCLTALRLSFQHQANGDLIEDSVDGRGKLPFRLTMIETSMILTGASALFVVFIAIQGRYLFGGQANITAQGYTYADYARRGFYEILMVSLMVVGLVLGLDVFTHRKREREVKFRALSIGMVLLTVLLLVAAFQRLLLYEDAYGFTRRRVMTQVFMIWLGILFLFLVRDILYRRRRVFWIGCIFAGMGFVFTLNLMNMDAFIAARNIDRFEATGKLDEFYLLGLSDDAIPVTVRLLDNDKLDETRRSYLATGLYYRLLDLEQDRHDRGVLGFHFGKSRAYAALDDYRDRLKPDPLGESSSQYR